MTLCILAPSAAVEAAEALQLQEMRRGVSVVNNTRLLSCLTEEQHRLYRQAEAAVLLNANTMLAVFEGAQHDARCVWAWTQFTRRGRGHNQLVSVFGPPGRIFRELRNLSIHEVSKWNT